MQSAILRGLYNFNSQPEFTCGGSCRWNGSYISLGFKSECTNVTAETLKSQHCTVNADGFNVCNLTTPAGIGLRILSIPSGPRTTFQINTAADWDDDFQSGYEPRDIDIPRMAVYRATADKLGGTIGSSNINITDCHLRFAAYEYSNARANGSVFSFESIRQVNLSDGEYGDCDGIERIGWGSTSWGCWTWQVISNNGSVMKNSPTLTLYSLDMLSLVSFFLSDPFRSEWIAGVDINSNPGLSAVLRGDVDLSQVFQEMAMSMTDYLRNGPNGMLARGDRIESRIFVSIRWYWLVGPVAIELAGLILTVLTIVSNRRNVPLWKSSALAVLACRHDEEDSLMRTKIRDMQEIIKVAESSKAQLE